MSENKNISNRAFKAGIGYTIGNYLLKGLTFLTLPLFTRLLNTEDYGKFNIFISYESVLSVIIGFSLHSCLKNAKYKFGTIQEGAESGHDYNTFVSSSFLLIFLNTILFIVLTNVFSKYISGILELDNAGLNLLVLYSFANAILSCYNSYVTLEFKYKNYLFVAALNAIGNIGLSLLFICTLFSKYPFWGRLIGNFIPIFLISVFIFLFFILRNKPKNLFSFWKWGLLFSLPIIPHSLSQILLTQFDRFMILKMYGNSEAGIYSFAFICFSLVIITTSSFDGAWTPWFYEKMKNEDFDEIKEKSLLFITLMFCFFAGIILGSPEIIKIAGAKEYWDATYCVIPLVAGGFFTFLYLFPVGIEYYHEKTKSIMLGTVFATLINIVLNYLLIPKYGYVSAAWTTLVTYILYFVFHFLMGIHIQKKCLFSLKSIILSSIGIIGISFFSLWMTNLPFVRWGLCIVLVIIFVLFEEKKIGFFIKKLKQVSKN